MNATYQQFTVIWRGRWPWEARSFYSDQPITWKVARDRLIAAGVIEASLAGRTADPDGWMLSVDPNEHCAPCDAEQLP